MLWTLISWLCVGIVGVEALAVVVIMWFVVTSRINDPIDNYNQRRLNDDWDD